MIIKRLIQPERLRQVPPTFSWIDHRLVRQNFLTRCSRDALALYLFLVTVAYAQGLSYYSDPAIGRHLHMTSLELAQARQGLISADLLAFAKPLYQVLSLVDPASFPSGPAQREKRSGPAQSLGQILRQVLPAGGGEA